KADLALALVALSRNLNLLSSDRGELAEHLVKTYTDIVENQKMTTFNWVQREDNAWVMVRQVIELGKKVVTQRAIPMAYAAISCMTDISLRNVLMPLSYSDKDTDGNITISFKYLDGSKGDFTVDSKYWRFFQLVERYAATRNPIPGITRVGLSNRRSGGTKPPFLLPLGKQNHTYQWSEGKVPISSYLLNLCGIDHGDYFLNINSSRIRVTHSDLEYKPEERGLTAQ
ncbi:hypothetical protein P3549_23820, partial [Vibrio parahaemolyticus]|nr:hypothetical protein [Vibrio parahaemolyticus]